ncbi:asparagine--tRNA ligase [Ostreibacterium oceani]|uniref:Asparagine--tRNA ligase n=1 Tax=Ostreibacterium oceani TaxID=2654998 RepID=A0A6N7ETP6_9GAMM|nr:asparagine--tRNA ligase [Ostreibacterium oceani]MPV85931.1 asparagine--tRNA ligase [Ostreibacterium oceani]
MTADNFKWLKQSKEKIGTTVTLSGWVRTIRTTNAGVSFLSLFDGSDLSGIQAVVPDTLANYEQVIDQVSGCAVCVTGELVASQGKGQQVEVQACHVDIIGEVEDPQHYPIQPKRHSMEFLRSVAHLRPRTNVFAAVTRIRHAVSMAIHQHMSNAGFYWIHTPIITGSDCEGAGDLFRVSTLDALKPPLNTSGEVDFTQDFFGKETFLAVSGQLNVEAFAQSMRHVYTFGPTFRAENSNTSRHLAEFWMVEPEMAFTDLSGCADCAETLLKGICQSLLTHHSEDLAFFDQFVEKGVLARVTNLASQGFERLTYSQAITILEQSGQAFEYPVKWGIDLQSEHERFLVESHFKRPAVVTDYPKDIKSFYMRLNDDEKTVAAMDVLAPGIGEIIGGSQREERLDVLTKRMLESGLNPDDYGWYLDLRRYGSTPHSGFGLGLERLVSYVTGVSNVRDVIAFPRTPGHAPY